MGFWSSIFGGKKKPARPTPAAARPLPQAPSKPDPSRPLMAGLYEFCGWEAERLEFEKVPGSQCPYPRPWDSLRTDNRKMALSTPGMAPGTYDESDPVITVERIKMCEEAGVGFLVKQIDCSIAHMLRLIPEEEREGAKLPSWARPFPGAPFMMEHCADNHSALDTPVKFCVSRWGGMSNPTNATDDRERATYWKDLRAHGFTANTVAQCERLYARLIAMRYMTKDTYLHVSNRPVLFMGNAESLRFYEAEFGITPEQMVQIYREEVRAVTGKELFLMATATPPDYVNPANPSAESPLERANLKQWGFDGFSPYALHGNGWPNAMDVHRYWRARDLRAARASGLQYWPVISTGYDATAWGSPETVIYIPTAKEFEAHVREVRAFSSEHFDITGGHMTIEADSEFGEGSVFEKMQPGQLHDGDEMIRAHREACA